MRSHHATCWLQLTSFALSLMCVEHLQARHHLVRLLLSLLHRALLRTCPHPVSLSVSVPPVGALWLLLSAASSAYNRDAACWHETLNHAWDTRNLLASYTYDSRTTLFSTFSSMLQIRHHLVRLLPHPLHQAHLRPHPHQVTLAFSETAVANSARWHTPMWVLQCRYKQQSWISWEEGSDSQNCKSACILLPTTQKLCSRLECWIFAGPPPPSPPPPSPPPPSPPPPSPPPSESWPCRTCWGGFVTAICSWWLHKGWCFLLTWNADHARDACNMLAALTSCVLYYILNMLQIRHHRVRLLLHLLHRALLRPHPHQVSLSFIVPAILLCCCYLQLV